MKQRSVLMIAAALAAAPAFAQGPAGTPAEDRGYPSGMGNPTPMEKLEVHRTEDGRWVTEDGREVVGFPKDYSSIPNRNLHHTDPDDVEEDPPHYSATPGELE